MTKIKMRPREGRGAGRFVTLNPAPKRTLSEAMGETTQGRIDKGILMHTRLKKLNREGHPQKSAVL